MSDCLECTLEDLRRAMIGELENRGVHWRYAKEIAQDAVDAAKPHLERGHVCGEHK